MKKNPVLLSLIVLPMVVFSQTKPVKIVFDVTSKDTSTHQSVLRHVKGMAAQYPDALLEVVIYGGAWTMVVDQGSGGREAVQKLAAQKNVSFKICQLSMQRVGIERSDLIPGVEVVPDAIIEIVTRQNEGWGYIKESHH